MTTSVCLCVCLCARSRHSRWTYQKMLLGNLSQIVCEECFAPKIFEKSCQKTAKKAKHRFPLQLQLGSHWVKFTWTYQSKCLWKIVQTWTRAHFLEPKLYNKAKVLPDLAFQGFPRGFNGLQVIQRGSNGFLMFPKCAKVSKGFKGFLGVVQSKIG